MQKRFARFVMMATMLTMLSSSMFAGYTFKLNLEKGKTYRQNQVSESKIKQSVNGMSMVIDVVSTIHNSYEVTNVTKDFFELNMKMEYIKVEVKSDFGSVEMDSRSNDTNNAAATMLKKFTEVSYPVKLNTDGTIREIGSIDTVINRIMNETPNLSAMERNQMESQFKQSFGSNTMKNNLEGIASIYPKKAVAIGESWEMQSEAPSVITLSTKNKYTLKEVDGDWAKLEITSEMMTPNASDTTQINGMPAQAQLNGSMEGIITLNMKTGWTTRSEMKQTIKGNLNILDSAMVPGGMKIPMEVENKITITE
jgi:hypothetical protein